MPLCVVSLVFPRRRGIVTGDDLGVADANLGAGGSGRTAGEDPGTVHALRELAPNTIDDSRATTS
jgi:hypothetical protein